MQKAPAVAGPTQAEVVGSTDIADPDPDPDPEGMIVDVATVDRVGEVVPRDTETEIDPNEAGNGVGPTGPASEAPVGGHPAPKHSSNERCDSTRTETVS